MPPAYLPTSLSAPGLSLLLEAFDCATDAGCAPWDFAVSLDALQRAAMAVPAIQWLIAKECLEHQHEFTPPGDDERLFRMRGKWNFHRRSRFVLTLAGAQFARTVLGGQQPEPQLPDLPATTEMQPKWNARAGVLTLAGQVLLQFSRPAPSERAVLDGFQKQGWINRIDDPFPSETVGNPKRRLHNTINALNRKQIVWRIKFSGDGTGRGVCWSLRRGEE